MYRMSCQKSCSGFRGSVRTARASVPDGHSGAHFAVHRQLCRVFGYDWTCAWYSLREGSMRSIGQSIPWFHSLFFLARSYFNRYFGEKGCVTAESIAEVAASDSHLFTVQHALFGHAADSRVGWIGLLICSPPYARCQNLFWYFVCCGLIYCQFEPRCHIRRIVHAYRHSKSILMNGERYTEKPKKSFREYVPYRPTESQPSWHTPRLIFIYIYDVVSFRLSHFCPRFEFFAVMYSARRVDMPMRFRPGCFIAHQHPHSSTTLLHMFPLFIFFCSLSCANNYWNRIE